MPSAKLLFEVAHTLEREAYRRIAMKARPKRGRFERQASRSMEPLIDAMEDDIIGRLQTTDRELGSITTDFVFRHRDGFIAAGQAVAADAAQYGANVAIQRAQRKGQSLAHRALPERIMEEILDDAADGIQTSLQNMRRQVISAIRGASTREEAIAAVQDRLASFRRTFIQRMARERAAAMERAMNWVMANVTTFEFQQWLTEEDERVRDSHDEQHGEVVAIGHKFSNGLEYPGDKRGPLEEWINCRCFLEPWEVPEGFKLPSDPTQPFHPDKPSTIERIQDATEEFRQWRADR